MWGTGAALAPARKVRTIKNVRVRNRAKRFICVYPSTSLLFTCRSAPRCALCLRADTQIRPYPRWWEGKLFPSPILRKDNPGHGPPGGVLDFKIFHRGEYKGGGYQVAGKRLDQDVEVPGGPVVIAPGQLDLVFDVGPGIFAAP